jgi:hypothetical protein
VSPPGEIRTPPPNTTYHLRGDPTKTTLPSKTALPKNSKSCFSSFNQFSEDDSGKMEDVFSKIKRGFCSSRAEEQKPLPYFSQVPPVGRIKAIFQPHFFSFSVFPVSVLILRELFRRSGDKLEKPKRFFLQNIIIYNNLLHFFHRCHR